MHTDMHRDAPTDPAQNRPKSMYVAQYRVLVVFYRGFKPYLAQVGGTVTPLPRCHIPGPGGAQNRVSLGGTNYPHF